MMNARIWLKLICAASLAAGCSADDDAHPQQTTAGVGGEPAGGAKGGAGVGGTGAASGASGGQGGASGMGAVGATGGGAGGAGAAGGGAGGAGTGGAGADAGVDAGSGAPVDPCDTALFCETFEGYAAGSPPGGDWQTQTNHGAVSVVDDPRFGGAKSARFTTEQSSGGKTAFIRLASAAVFPVPGNAYYGRMMFRLESAPDTSVHWTFIQSGGTVAGQSYHALYRYGGQHPITEGATFVGNQLMANYDTPDSYSGNGPGSDCWLHADKKVVPVGRWACAEWQFDGPNDTMRFWLDGQPLDDLTMDGVGQGCVNQPASFAWTAPAFADLAVGWESYQSDMARTLYVDDVVISTQRVGCPAAP